MILVQLALMVFVIMGKLVHLVQQIVILVVLMVFVIMGKLLQHVLQIVLLILFVEMKHVMVTKLVERLIILMNVIKIVDLVQLAT